MNPPLGRRPRVILVDDDPGLLRLLTLRLKSEGYDVAASENATQAQTAIPRFQPDVVVTDLRMADVDGIGLLRELQRRYPALPVILMTAHGTIPDAVEATKSGAFAFLTKPVDKDQLLEQLQKRPLLNCLHLQYLLGWLIIMLVLQNYTTLKFVIISCMMLNKFMVVMDLSQSTK